MVPAEEQLMLLGYASTEKEAQLILTGGRERDENVTPQLYSAPDPEEDERAARAIEEMADCMLQLQESVASGPTDPSILKVINESKAFFEFGVQPTRGLDAVDKLLMRKKTLMDHCGNRSDHFASRQGISDQMFCAVRIHMLNESDLDVVCPSTSGAFWTSDGDEKRCQGGGFNWTRPISEENEHQTIIALRQTTISLLSNFPSTKEEDDRLLEESADGVEQIMMGPIKRNAILIRARERRILYESIFLLNQRKRNLKQLSYQITEVREKEQERKRLLEEKARFKERAVEEFLSRNVLINMSVVEVSDKNSAITNTNFTVCEGDNLELLARTFVNKHGNGQIDTPTLVSRAKKELLKSPTKQIIFMFPVVLSNGTRTILRMRQQDDGTEEVMKFCAVHNMTDRICDWMRSNLATHVEQHFKDSILATASLQAPDGRELIIYLRQGDQHDLTQFVTDYVSVTKLPINVIPSITMMLERKLQPTIFEQSISGEGRLGIQLKLKRGDNAKDVVMAFGRRKGMPVEAQNQVLTALLQRGF